MEYINKDEVKELLREIRREYLLNMENEKLLGVQEAFRVVCKAPTIDAVPVVRCGQCNHYRPHDGWCSVWGSHIASEDYYCADGFPKVGDE